MENSQNFADPKLTPDQISFLHLIDRALTEGVIREDRLQDCLKRLDPTPEVVKNLYEQLQMHNIRVIPCVKEPRYTPELHRLISELLEQQGHLLSEREHLVLTLRLKENKSLAEVAERMGVTQERILQVERKAVRLISRSRTSERLKKIRDFCK